MRRLIVLVLLTAVPLTVWAARGGHGSTGIGLQLGEPTALSVFTPNSTPGSTFYPESDSDSASAAASASGITFNTTPRNHAVISWEPLELHNKVHLPLDGGGLGWG